MSSQVLARKWRPRTFATLVGQDHVVRALSNALDSGRLHHAYLFTGTRGVGKTTIARILAKALNCEQGVSSHPCGTCSSCQEIDGGRFVDLIEVDAATNTKVDEMRQLLENAVYAPTRGRYKVYVIDEVHMLSNSAFNAMLKTLEEPPEHIKFILATTDPQKIPVTVLSRCLQFNLKQMSAATITQRLGEILAAENIAADAPALRHLAKAAAGSMRDALSLLDQAIAHGAGRIEEAAVRDMLGTVSDDHVFQIVDALASGDVKALMRLGDRMEERSLSFESALQELATLVHRIALTQFAPDAIADEAERSRLSVYAQRFDAEFLQLAYQIAVQGREQLALAPDEATGFAMTLLRLFAFRPLASGPMPARGPEVGGQALPAGVGTAGAGAAPVAVAVPAAPTIGEVAPRAVPAESPAAPLSTAGAEWHAVVDSLSVSGMVRQLAQHCELAGIDNETNTVSLRLPPAHKHLAGKVQQDKLEAELQRHYGRPLRLNVALADAEGETPAERSRAAQRQRQERAIASIESDGFVRNVVDLFDASIDESSIKPI